MEEGSAETEIAIVVTGIVTATVVKIVVAMTVAVIAVQGIPVPRVLLLLSDILLMCTYFCLLL